MERLSRPLSAMRAQYDVVVVGSGYGGAITASRLARAGRSVCLLERGAEMLPGEYPESAADAVGRVQVNHRRRRTGPPDALFDFHTGRDISVLVGCGLGGTSLINANVALEADPRVFDDERWPEPLRGGADPLLLRGYEDARRMLGSNPLPDDHPVPAKLVALGTTARELGREVVRPPINVTFTDGPNAVGVHQMACTGCGNCFTGCNVGAKNTVLMNYLPDAVAHGAQVFTRVEVHTVEPGAEGVGWRVAFRPVGDGSARFHAPTRFVHAEVVVLAAGTLGSTGILLRSAQVGLPVSEMLGERFSGNGDVLAFAYDSAHVVNGVGWPGSTSGPGEPPGPCITGMVDVRDVPRVDDGLVIEDAVIPGALAPILPASLPAAAMLGGTSRWNRANRGRTLVSRAKATAGKRADELARTQTYLVMSSEDEFGRIVLEGDRAHVEWPDVGKRPVFARDNAVLRRAAAAVEGTFVMNPLWTRALDQSVITVHPLGGCVMGADASSGVVDERGRVFAGPAGTAIHDGLYVADGSIVPRPLGVNPLLTISALAERISALMIRDRGWAGGDGRREDHEMGTAAAGLEFTERMHGYVSTRFVKDYEAGYRQGRAEGSSIEFVVTVEATDADAFVHRPYEPVPIAGTVIAPALSPRRMVIVDGAFTLFAPDPDRVETSRMRYELPLLAEDGRRYRLSGHKLLRRGSALGAWKATTTLYVKIYDESDAVVARGMMTIGVGDFVRQLTTMRTPGTHRARDAARVLARFSGMFTRELLTRYGGVVGDLIEPEPVAAGPARRLRLPDPEIVWCRGDREWVEDPVPDAWLRLTRFRGGDKGPVLLAPGFGMSTSAFRIDTIDTNLAEFLVERGYDVWLLDYRGSSDLASARLDFTLDDVAMTDWPAAVDEVRRRTGAPSVQAVGHCMGSMALLMAGLGGADGIRSMVCSQVTTHPVTSKWNQRKLKWGVGRRLEGFGFRTISPDATPTMSDHLLDVVLRNAPVPREERCGNMACHWIAGFYGPTHHHAQLNEATHDAIGSMFGVANVHALNHIGRICEAGTSVDAEGADAYLPHVDRLALPILFLAGAKNRIFLPETSARTLRWLTEHNDPSLYRRVFLDDYAHLDGFIGRDASRDVFPSIARHLDETATV